MMSNVPSQRADEKVVAINEKIFRPGVLNRLKQIAMGDGAVLLLHKNGNGKVSESFGEVGKVIKNISFIHSDDREKMEGTFAGTFFIAHDGTINFA
ncbi:MAG: hypothetical protein WC619_01385 [Patescibacteria group bacterium]